MMNIRPFDHSEADQRAVLHVLNTTWPDSQETLEERQHREAQRDQTKYFQRELFELDGQVIGFGTYSEVWWHEIADRYVIYVDILPEYQGRGFGSYWYKRVLAKLLQRDAKSIMANTREDRPHSVSFLEHRGFQCVMREPESFLNVETFIFSKFAWTKEKMANQGIQIVTLNEAPSLAQNWKVLLSDLMWEIHLDMPDDVPPKRQSQEAFEKRFFGWPNYTPDSHFVAIDTTQNNKWVGYSSLSTRSGEPDSFNVGLTGVTRSHRRKGIATALKVRSVAYAQTQNAKKIVTGNEENNPMYQLNLQLGFEPLPAWLLFRKDIEGA